VRRLQLEPTTLHHWRVRLDGSIVGVVARLRDDWETWHWIAYRDVEDSLPLGVFPGQGDGKVEAVRCVVEYDAARRQLDMPALTGRSYRMDSFLQ